MNVKQKDCYVIGDRVRSMITHKKTTKTLGVIHSVEQIYGFRKYPLYRFGVDMGDGIFDFYTWQLCIAS